MSIRNPQREERRRPPVADLPPATVGQAFSLLPSAVFRIQPVDPAKARIPPALSRCLARRARFIAASKITAGSIGIHTHRNAV